MRRTASLLLVGTAVLSACSAPPADATAPAAAPSTTPARASAPVTSAAVAASSPSPSRSWAPPPPETGRPPVQPTVAPACTGQASGRGWTVALPAGATQTTTGWALDASPTTQFSVTEVADPDAALTKLSIGSAEGGRQGTYGWPGTRKLEMLVNNPANRGPAGVTAGTPNSRREVFLFTLMDGRGVVIDTIAPLEGHDVAPAFLCAASFKAA